MLTHRLRRCASIETKLCQHLAGRFSVLNIHHQLEPCVFIHINCPLPTRDAYILANTRHTTPEAGTMLGQRVRRKTQIEPAFDPHRVFAGMRFMTHNGNGNSSKRKQKCQTNICLNLHKCFQVYLTSVQHCINVIQMFCVYWACINVFKGTCINGFKGTCINGFKGTCIQ